MKKILLILFLISSISFSQEFKLNNENVQNLESLSIKVEYNKYINDLKPIVKSYKIGEDKLVSAIKAKIKKFKKEQSKTKATVNRRRAEEVEKDAENIRLYRRKHLKNYENKLSDGLISLLTIVSQKENCVVIFDDEIIENKTVYLDRERQDP